EATPSPVFDAAVGIDADPVARLMALTAPGEEVALEISRRLRLSNAVRDRMTAAARAGADIALDMADPAVRAAIYRHGRQAVAAASPNSLPRRRTRGACWPSRNRGTRRACPSAAGSLRASAFCPAPRPAGCSAPSRPAGSPTISRPTATPNGWPPSSPPVATD